MNIKHLNNLTDYFYNLSLRIKKASNEDATLALTKWLSRATKNLGVAQHVYVVGGAVRNYLLNKPIKDIDIVIDSISVGHDSEWLANQLAIAIPTTTRIVTNDYGVAILTVTGEWDLDGIPMKGEVIEIANAREESYDKTSDSEYLYKPTSVKPVKIEDDLKRREFTFNTLLWRLADLEEGHDKAEVLDLLGTGKADLEAGLMRTPVDPDITFSDDPTRMLRAIKFITKYDFKLPDDVRESILRNKNKLTRVPPAALSNILQHDILEGPNPPKSIELLKELGIIDGLKEVLKDSKQPSVKQLRNTLEAIIARSDASTIPGYMSLDWDLRTPADFLSKEEKLQLLDALKTFSNSQEANSFLTRLKKPKINIVFDELRTPAKDRGLIVNQARKLLLANPLQTDEELASSLIASHKLSKDAILYMASRFEKLANSSWKMPEKDYEKYLNTVYNIGKHTIPVSEHSELHFKDVPAGPDEHHPEIFQPTHNDLVFQRALELMPNSPEGQYAALLHDLGKGVTDPTIWPKQHSHESLGVPLVEDISTRLNVPEHYKTLAKFMAKNHLRVHQSEGFTDKAIRSLISDFKKEVGDDRDAFTTFLLACQSDAQGRTNFKDRHYPQVQKLLSAWDSIKNESEKKKLEQLAITGKDLTNIGVPPGPAMGKILSQLKQFVKDNPDLNNFDDLMREADKLKLQL
jgi:hypothetical protein